MSEKKILKRDKLKWYWNVEIECQQVIKVTTKRDIPVPQSAYHENQYLKKYFIHLRTKFADINVMHFNIKINKKYKKIIGNNNVGFNNEIKICLNKFKYIIWK